MAVTIIQGGRTGTGLVPSALAREAAHVDSIVEPVDDLEELVVRVSLRTGCDGPMINPGPSQGRCVGRCVGRARLVDCPLFGVVFELEARGEPRGVVWVGPEPPELGVEDS